MFKKGDRVKVISLPINMRVSPNCAPLRLGEIYTVRGNMSGGAIGDEGWFLNPEYKSEGLEVVKINGNRKLPDWW